LERFLFTVRLASLVRLERMKKTAYWQRGMAARTESFMKPFRGIVLLVELLFTPQFLYTYRFRHHRGESRRYFLPGSTLMATTDLVASIP